MHTLCDAKTTKIVVTSTLELHELRTLLDNLRKSIELWFLMNRDEAPHNKNELLTISSSYESSFYQIQTNTTAILQHGLRPLDKLQSEKVKVSASAAASSQSSPLNDSVADDVFQKLIDDFEWVRRYAKLRDTVNDDVNDANNIKTATSVQSSDTTTTAVTNIKQFLLDWTLRNLKSKCLCACLQTLVADKELLKTYYSTGSFLRSETFATALFISLSALELKRSILLSQIEPPLYRSVSVAPAAVKHKRSNSHPNFSISPTLKIDLQMQVDGYKKKEQQSIPSENLHIRPPSKVFHTFRKIKSLPVLINVMDKSIATPDISSTRPRSKTMAAMAVPKSMPKKCSDPKHASDLTLAIASSSPSYCSDDTQPSTSAASKLTLASFSSSSNTSQPSESSTTTARRIQLIKCDDIKIWTDQSWQQQQEKQQQEEQSQSTPKRGDSLGISSPQSVKAKSISPINSFLASLFNTPPAYTNWSFNQKSSSFNVEANDESAAFPCNAYHEKDNTNSMGVFDSFLPKYGKKLRSRKSQNLFEDGVSSLDQKYYDCTPNIAIELKGDSEEIMCDNEHNNIQKDNQSLTTFLQMAQLSRNNTELEKENAHFRISEAIISAIEHIKWAKLEPDKWRRENETITAMDCLENERKNKSDLIKNNETKCTVPTDEHIPYAELGETCLDPISAEVVGLCLISKFSDQHLPKVSELKWLVSEEDTKQSLLPMPDNSTSANPDENILPSVTRGTKYWAPPRQQIIFTDHPMPNRKELIQKQSNRCAGCGMRVAPQYLNSFRYCTYLGKYHCTGCHRNQISATPAKILQMWDFKCYPVSVFAYRLLEQMYTFPLFYVPDLNPVLYTRSKLLLMARTKRVQLSFVKDFIKCCRFATVEQQYFESIPDYICSDPDTWSMSDFIDTNNKSLHRFIDEFIVRCENHIFSCVLCSARGFICEHCSKEEVIYPWQKKVFRCDRCGTCFHLSCWKSMMDDCCRCQRIKNRQDETSEIMLNSY